ncbi:hypothetical protein I633_22176 (plasmid) [Alteromonas mediterranea 615]|uniref:Oocyst wall protein n=1 Tax=Alteromonas mediterranea 615 TaxID=1300253 RepID=S5ASL3_9ALTE|nr:hypothetical protein I633_22176 [Alteromonas mediterranea 615]
MEQPDMTKGQCPVDYVLNTTTGQCENIKSTSVTYTCPSDPRYTLDSDECKFYEDKQYTTYCPDGGELTQGGALCEIRLQSEANVECADPRATPDLENGRCVFTERSPFIQAEFVEE